MLRKAIYVVNGETVTVLKEMKFENPDFGTAVLVLDSNGNVDMAFKYLFEFEEVPIDAVWKTENYIPDKVSEAERDGALELSRQDDQNIVTYPLGSKYTIGKGKTVWTIDGYSEGDIHVSREGKGINVRWVRPEQLKKIK